MYLGDSKTSCKIKKVNVKKFSNDNKITVNSGNQSGFTLVELALVISGLAIISFGAYVVSARVLDNARISSVTSQIESLKTALELAKLHTGCQPNSLVFLVKNEESYTQCGGAGSVANWEGPYIKNAEIVATPGATDLGQFKLGNIADNAFIQLVENSDSDVVLESNTVGTIGVGVVSNLCPSNSTTPVGGEDDITSLRPCGFKHVGANDKNKQFFWIGQ